MSLKQALIDEIEREAVSTGKLLSEFRKINLIGRHMPGQWL